MITIHTLTLFHHTLLKSLKLTLFQVLQKFNCIVFSSSCLDGLCPSFALILSFLVAPDVSTISRGAGRRCAVHHRLHARVGDERVCSGDPPQGGRVPHRGRRPAGASISSSNLFRNLCFITLRWHSALFSLAKIKDHDCQFFFEYQTNCAAFCRQI